MSAKTEQPAADPRSRRQGWLWFGVATGPIAWALHLVLVYAVQTLSCQWGFLQFNVLGLHALRLTLLLLTGLILAIVIWSSFVAYGFWRQFGNNGVDRPEGDRFRFMAFSGLLLNIFFAVAIVLSMVPVLTLSICAGGGQFLR